MKFRMESIWPEIVSIRPGLQFASRRADFLKMKGDISIREGGGHEESQAWQKPV
jgi:hypothetical protein